MNSNKLYIPQHRIYIIYNSSPTKIFPSPTVIMQLSKHNIITLNISQNLLSSNFYRIEQQFKRLKYQIHTLHENSISIIQKLNSIDPFDCIDACQLNGHQNGKQGTQASRHKNENVSIGTNNAISKINVCGQSEDCQHSQTVIQAKDGIEKMCDVEPKPNLSKKRREPQSRESQVSLAHNSRNEQTNQQPIRQFNPRQSSQESMIRQFIKALEERVKQLQQSKDKSDTKIQSLQKDNQRFKKMLGFGQSRSSKHNLKKQQNANKLNQEHRAQTRKSKQRISQSTPHPESNDPIKQSEQPKQNNFQQTLQQNNFVTSLNKQFSQLKQYIRSKVFVLQGNLQKCITQIGENKIQISQTRQDINDNQRRVTFLQQKQKQNYNYFERIAKNKTPSTSIDTRSNIPYSRTKTSVSQLNNLNDTVQSYKNYYEDKIVEIFQQMDRIRSEYYNVLSKLPTEENNTSNQQRLKNIATKLTSISSPNDEKFKKQISTLRRQLKKLRDQFSDLIGDVNTGANQTRTLIIKPNQNKQDWKDITQKIFKLKQQLLSYVKQLEGKISANSDMTIVIQELEVGISQCKILNGKKVNITDFQKFSKRIEARLNNFIRQVCEKQGMVNEQEALIAKQPWFCLSCDSELKNYSGKLGKPIYNEKMTGKKVNPQSHMVRRPDQSKLPSVH